MVRRLVITLLLAATAFLAGCAVARDGGVFHYRAGAGSALHEDHPWITEP